VCSVPDGDWNNYQHKQYESFNNPNEHHQYEDRWPPYAEVAARARDLVYTLRPGSPSNATPRSSFLNRQQQFAIGITATWAIVISRVVDVHGLVGGTSCNRHVGTVKRKDTWDERARRKKPVLCRGESARTLFSYTLNYNIDVHNLPIADNICDTISSVKWFWILGAWIDHILVEFLGAVISAISYELYQVLHTNVKAAYVIWTWLVYFSAANHMPLKVYGMCNNYIYIMD
jgi:hypothetical protein